MMRWFYEDREHADQFAEPRVSVGQIATYYWIKAMHRLGIFRDGLHRLPKQPMRRFVLQHHAPCMSCYHPPPSPAKKSSRFFLLNWLVARPKRNLPRAVAAEGYSGRRDVSKPHLAKT